MLSNNTKPPLVVIVGPTGVGKTEISLQLAHQLNGEIVSADSRLFYQGMDIGTAKPSLQERTIVPHHLIDITTPDKPWSLALFQGTAKEVIQEIQRHNRLPFLVGGTGQYIQAVIEAWEIPAQSPDDSMRNLLTEIGTRLGAIELHHRLSLIDPDAAALIEPNNLRRTVRAFEVIFLTGQKFSQQRRKGKSPYAVCKIGLIRPRSELYQRIDQRIDHDDREWVVGGGPRFAQSGIPNRFLSILSNWISRNDPGDRESNRPCGGCYVDETLHPSIRAQTGELVQIIRPKYSLV